MKAPDSQQANVDWKNDVVYKRENVNDTAVDDVDDDKTKENTCFHCNVVGGELGPRAEAAKKVLEIEDATVQQQPVEK